MELFRSGSLPLYFACPHPEYRPAGSPESRPLFFVPLDIRFYFLNPVVAAFSAPLDSPQISSVPKVAVYKNCPSLFRNGDVGAPGRSFVVPLESNALALKVGENLHLRSGIFRSDTGHDFAPFLFSENIGHSCINPPAHRLSFS